MQVHCIPWRGYDDDGDDNDADDDDDDDDYDDGDDDDDDDVICGQRKARVRVYCILGRGNIANSLERNACVQNYHHRHQNNWHCHQKILN